MVADNSKHKKEDQPVDEPEQLFHSLFENAPIGMGVSDAEGNLIAFNEAMLKPGGYTREDIEKIRNVANLYYDAQERAEALQLASKQGFLKDYEIRFKRKDGTAFWGRMSLTPIVYKGQKCWQAVVEDITDEKRTQEELKRHAAETYALARIANLLVQGGTFQENATQVLGQIVSLAQADGAVLRLPDEKEQGLSLIATIDGGKRPPRPKFVPYGQGIVNSVMKKGEPLVVNDYKSHPHASKERIAQGVASVAFFPIKSSEHKLGIVAVSSSKPNHFDDTKTKMLTAVTSQLGSLLENARLMESLDSRTKELEALSKIADLLVQSGTFESKMARVIEVVADVAEADKVVYRQVDQSKEGLVLVAKATRNGKWEPSLVLSISKSIVGEAYRTGLPVVINDFDKSPQAEALKMNKKVKSLVGMPVMLGKHPVGVMALTSPDKNHFSPERVRTLCAIADSMASLLDNARLMDQLQKRTVDSMGLNSQLRQRTKEITVLNDMFQETLDERFALTDAFNDLRTRLQGIYSIADMAIIDGDPASTAARLKALRQLLQEAVSRSDPEKLPKLKRILTPRDA